MSGLGCPRYRAVIWIACALAVLPLSACGGGGGSSDPGGGSGSGGGGTLSIGGSVNGLSASGLVLVDNGTDTLSVPSGARSFMFATKLQSGASYDVTVKSQPTGETCTVASGGGTATANVTSVAVTCSANTYTISGTIMGLSASGLRLQYYSGGQVLSVADGSSTFAFSQPVPSGTNVKMDVVAQPYWVWCTPGSSDFSGPITGNITTDTLSCAAANAHVTTLAGSTTAGSANGTGSAASFNSPSGVAISSGGSVYVTDTVNNEIRKITPAGVVTTFAGSTTPGNKNGVGTGAQFHAPEGVAIDSSGNLYVADTTNNEIRKIAPGGTVTTFAGSGTAGNSNGTGTGASFSRPEGVAVDAAGDVYVADTGNNEIRMITPTGVVSTLAGSPTGGPFNQPIGVAVDSSGTIYVADFANNEIETVTSAGVVTVLAGSTTRGSSDGTGSAASFYGPSGVVVDSLGNLYVADTNNNEIRKITPAGVVTTLAGSTTAGSTDGTGSSASFKLPFGMAVDASSNLYVGDFGNNEIRKIAPGP